MGNTNFITGKTGKQRCDERITKLDLVPRSGLNPTCFCSLKEYFNFEASPRPREMEHSTCRESGVSFLIPYQFLNQIYGLGIFVEAGGELLVLFHSFSNTEQIFIHVIWIFQQNFGCKWSLNRKNILYVMN